MSVDGVAIATIISQYVSGIMMILFLTKTVGYMHLNLRKIKLQNTPPPEGGWSFMKKSNEDIFILVSDSTNMKK